MLRPCEAMLLSGHHMRMYQRRMRDKSSKGQTISWPTVGARVIASAILMNASQMRSEYYPNVGAHVFFMRTFCILPKKMPQVDVGARAFFMRAYEVCPASGFRS